MRALISKRNGLSDGKVLQDGKVMGPMPWVLAILMFITVLAAAAGLAMGTTAYGLTNDLSHRLSVQIVEANPDIRHAQTVAVAHMIQATEGVERVEPVDDATLDKLVSPWLGQDGADAGLPTPSLIDVTLQSGATLDLGALKSKLASAAPNAHIVPDSQWLGPLVQLLSVMTWLAVAIVILMMVAVAAAVVLSARAALNTHRPTIDILHLMGSSDAQISGLFQRRIVIDAFVSGVIGLIAALIVLAMLQAVLATMQSEFLGAALMKWWAWLLLLLAPLMAAALANFTARATVLQALKQKL
jgi:cell division transport system permease protein